METRKMTKGLIFDLDGVIVDTANYHYIAWKKLSNEIGIDFDKEFNHLLKGISRIESLELILSHGNKSDVYSADEKKSFTETKNKYYLELLNNITPKDILPGVLDLIEQANNNHIPCAIASASENAPTILEKLGIKHYFKAIVDPKTLKKGKPDPEIFLRAAEFIHIPPHLCIGFEDSIAGIQSIKQAGMYVIGVTADGPLPEADLAVHSLTEIDIHSLF